jgi:hypothetical protein
MFTIPDYSSPTHQLFLDEAYGVIDSINLGYGAARLSPEPNTATGVNVNANVTIYASKSAFDAKALPLHNRNVNFQHADDNLTVIKGMIAEELSN